MRRQRTSGLYINHLRLFSSCLSFFIAISSGEGCGISECALVSTKKCVPSVYGTSCDECSHGRGYVQSNGVCSCYTKFDDPIQNCSQSVYLRSGLPAWTGLVPGPKRVDANIFAKCFTDPSVGFFKTPCDAVPYGQPLPCDPCSECLTSIFGPNVGTVTGANTIECNSYGAPDPDSIYPTWTPCAGHGTWDPNQYACVCDAGWGLNFIDNVQGWNGETPTVCNACAPFYGPTSTSQCGSIQTPDPVTGLFMECGGHGVFDKGSHTCSCFSNSTAGQWTLYPVTNLFPVVTVVSQLPNRIFVNSTISVTVQSCVSCLNSTFTPSNGCKP